MSEIYAVNLWTVEYEPEFYVHDGTSWSLQSYNLWFQTWYNQSQELYGLREVKQSQSNIRDRVDAQKWTNSYLASKDYPVKRTSLDLREQSDVLEGTPPQGLIAVRDPLLETEEVYEYELQKFSYKISESGIEVSIPLGELRPDIADLLKMIEDKIETNKEL